MLLIDDDDAQPLQRRENGAACADHDVRAILVNLEPLVVAFPIA